MNGMVKVRDTAERKISPNFGDQEDNEDIKREKEKR